MCVNRRKALNKRFHIYYEMSDKLRGSLSIYYELHWYAVFFL